MPILINNWNSLITIKLNPANAALHNLTKESIHELINQSEAEQEKARNLLIEGIVDRQKIRDKQQFVQIHQAMLIRLLNKIHSFKQTPKVNDEILCLYNTVSQHLEHTLDFIEDFFSDYFDRNEKVPAAYLIISIEELCRQLEQLRKSLQTSKSISPELTKILVDNFNRFCSQKKGGVTYNELIYQKELMNELLTDGTIQSEQSLKEVLFYFNFNDNDYISYLYEKLKDKLESLPGKKEKIAAIRLEQKNVNQLSTKLNVYLSSTMPPLKEQINHWIDEEIKFLEKENFQDIHETLFDRKDRFVHVTFKGPEIYLLHKAFIDAGGAPTENYKSLLEKTSCRLSNRNQKGFSPESLKKASDKVDPESKENVKRFLQKMIRNIDSYD